MIVFIKYFDIFQLIESIILIINTKMYKINIQILKSECDNLRNQESKTWSVKNGRFALKCLIFGNL